MCDWRTRGDLKNLCRTIAPSRNILPIKTEADTANNALVREIVKQLHIEDSPRAGIEHGEPVLSLFLKIVWQGINLKVGERVGLRERNLVGSHQRVLMLVRRRSGSWDLRRARIRGSRGLLGGSGTRRASRTTRATTFIIARGGRGLRDLVSCM
jgi:hypothetical protein